MNHLKALSDRLSRTVGYVSMEIIFIVLLDERYGWEICVHMVMQKCVKFDVVCTPDS